LPNLRLEIPIVSGQYQDLPHRRELKSHFLKSDIADLPQVIVKHQNHLQSARLPLLLHVRRVIAGRVVHPPLSQSAFDLVLHLTVMMFPKRKAALPHQITPREPVPPKRVLLIHQNPLHLHPLKSAAVQAKVLAKVGPNPGLHPKQNHLAESIIIIITRKTERRRKNTSENTRSIKSTSIRRVRNTRRSALETR